MHLVWLCQSMFVIPTYRVCLSACFSHAHLCCASRHGGSRDVCRKSMGFACCLHAGTGLCLVVPCEGRRPVIVGASLAPNLHHLSFAQALLGVQSTNSMPPPPPPARALASWCGLVTSQAHQQPVQVS